MDRFENHPQNPFVIFDEWYAEAKAQVPSHYPIIKKVILHIFNFVRFIMAKIYPPLTAHQPYEMTLATIGPSGFPESRIVLMKEYSREGFDFYTNYNSPKSKQIKNNNMVSVVFHWAQPERQIRIWGHCETLPYEVSDTYWQSRPRGSQISGAASYQSAILPYIDVVKNKIKELEKQYKGKRIPCPKYWGGHKIVPEKIEFWEGRPSRCHDRLLYTKIDNKWKTCILSP